MVLRYTVQQGSSPFPVSCKLTGGCEIETIVTCSSLLEAGSYVILPLTFNQWDLASKKVKTPLVGADDTATPDSKSCVLALHTSKEVQFHENIQTEPGFLADSIFLLPGKKSIVSGYFCTFFLSLLDLDIVRIIMCRLFLGCIWWKCLSKCAVF